VDYFPLEALTTDERPYFLKIRLAARADSEHEQAIVHGRGHHPYRGGSVAAGG
jgi:hypothetical protein